MNPLRYRGYYYDNETGYYYLQSRYYDPGLGRFISADDFSYIDASGKFSINAYAYCANNPLIYSDPTGFEYVTNEGKAIGDLIGILFISLEAQARLGDNFAAIVAGIFTLNPSSLHFKFDPGATQKEINKAKEKARNQFFKFFDKLANDFAKFMESAFYKLTSLIEGFYVDVFNSMIANQSMIASVNINRFLKITFGYGDSDGFFSKITDIFSGKFELFKFGDVSIGRINNGSIIGNYFELTQNICDRFFGQISFQFDIDISNLFPPNSGTAINTEFLSLPIIVFIIMVLSLFNCGDTELT